MKHIIHLIDNDLSRSEIMERTGISERQYTNIGRESGAFQRREERLERERQHLRELDEGQSHAELARITGRSTHWVQTWRVGKPRDEPVGVTWRRVVELEKEMPHNEAVNKAMLEWCP